MTFSCRDSSKHIFPLQAGGKIFNSNDSDRRRVLNVDIINNYRLVKVTIEGDRMNARKNVGLRTNPRGTPQMTVWDVHLTKPSHNQYKVTEKVVPLVLHGQLSRKGHVEPESEDISPRPLSQEVLYSGIQLKTDEEFSEIRVLWISFEVEQMQCFLF